MKTQLKPNYVKPTSKKPYSKKPGFTKPTKPNFTKPSGKKPGAKSVDEAAIKKGKFTLAEVMDKKNDSVQLSKEAQHLKPASSPAKSSHVNNLMAAWA